MGWEASPDYHERTRIMAYKLFFGNAAGILGSWLFALTQLDRFEDTLQGARFTGLMLGLVMLVFGLIPAFLVKEGNLEIALSEKRLSFVNSVRGTLKNKPFLMLCLIAVARDIPLNLINTIGLYVTIFYVFEGNMMEAAVIAGLAGTLTQITTMVALPSLTSMVTRASKIRTVKACLSLLIVATSLKWIACKPEWPWMILILGIILAVPLAGLNISIKSMIADVCDWDEWHTGTRREGMYASVYAWVGKAVGSIAVMLSGIILVSTGFDESLGKHQTESAISFMRLAFVLFPVMGAAIALFLVQFYPLTKARTYEIREELETRRGPTTG